ncbi:GDSL esterase/lipase At1g28570-like isoform X1 [Rhododendron vialii]|uniref:GDSL esterase/lipase At1g28570-like isoform X1 n=1 Tax=Rhododendron vialii TaxID=182163 RepID=UPI00265FABD0|nr:GDSL esterase/lipase At1g28570-like isoform X1 [Rhododendron vialii]
MGWFKEMLPSLCHSPLNCKQLLRSSLILMGEIGGNDYNHAFESGRSIQEIRSYVPLVVNVISSAIDMMYFTINFQKNGGMQEIIELGATTLMVPGNLPTGCVPFYLTTYMSSIEEDYDCETGCLIWLNEFAEYHNEMLQIELNRIQERHPHTTIIYADYYNAAMRVYHSPSEYGFSGARVLEACCGAKEGLHDFNATVECGYPPSRPCDDPSSYANWDGIHLTEAAYRWISTGLLEGPYTIPPIDTSCISSPVTTVSLK